MRSDPIYITVVDGRVLSGYIEDVTAELEINGLPVDATIMTVVVDGSDNLVLSPVFDPTEPADVEQAIELMAEHEEMMEAEA